MTSIRRQVNQPIGRDQAVFGDPENDFAGFAFWKALEFNP